MSTVMPTSSLSLALAVVVLFAACGSEEPPVPEMPSYAVDVRPIFEANCIKCHGANGMLNDALNPDGTPSQLGAPSVCYLSNYDDQGDCSDAGVLAGACKRGAHYCGTAMGDPPTSYIQLYAITLTQEQGGMPPLPAPPLSGWQKRVLAKWLESPIP
jgi:hypothetical protein